MRLVYCEDDGRLVLTPFLTDRNEVPPYAVLSHRWLSEEEEVNFDDMSDEDGKARQKVNGYKKIEFCARRAVQDHLRHFWVDTCCIDRRNAVELQETITSMFKWYRRSVQCYVYMTDVFATGDERGISTSSASWENAFRNSSWFTRGWTLQELLAPPYVTFYSVEGTRLGDKRSLQQTIHGVTDVPTDALQGRAMSDFTVEERLSWAEGRRTTRKEDEAYCLFGILEIYLPLIYGEGDNAWTRLRREIASKQLEARQADNLLEKLPFVSSASFNSRENEHEAYCLPNTRTEILSEIFKWVEGTDERRVFWLNGIAGTGKSTIARTVAKRYYQRKSLGGSFFFSKGGGDASCADKLFTTLAVQLGRNILSARQLVCESIIGNMDIALRALREQWYELILNPLKDLRRDVHAGNIVMIVDALDECGSERDIRIILNLFQLASSVTNVRLRILVTSRPEVPVRCGFLNVPRAERNDFVLEEVLPERVNRDIALYFRHSLQNIGKERKLPIDWPSEEDILRLVSKSSGLFEWAALACRYMSIGRKFAPLRMTKLIQGRQSEGSPERQLDRMYIGILRDTFQQDYDEDEQVELRRELREILGPVVVLFETLSLNALAGLLDTEVAEITETLSDLHTIIHIPGETDRPMRLHHPSFRDFLLDRTRCSDLDFWIDREAVHQALAKRCIEVMEQRLRRNICDLAAPGVTISEVSRDHINRCIPPELMYACLYWIEHCHHGNVPLHDEGQADRFLRKHFLHWLEVMSLCGRSHELASIIRTYQSLLTPANSSGQISFVKDARRFMYTFRSEIAETPLHIYTSAILFLRPSNTLRKHFWSQIYPMWKSARTINAISPREKDNYNYVNDITFSPDGKRVASGSLDGWIRIWDVTTMSNLERIGGQTDKTSSVQWSSDGTMLAAGSDDFTVEIVDAESRQRRHLLTEHSRWVNTVGFSPDGRLLASGSMDETIRIWDTKSGSRVALLDSISTGVNDLVFSPEGSSIAFGTVDSMVRLWDDFEENDVRAILDGHSGAVNSVAFSPDGKRIVSGSDDTSIRVWEVKASKEIMTLRGHSEPVWAVTFAPDGRVIASGSADMTIRLWVAESGDLRYVLQEHTSGINSVSFSPDGLLLASGSFDDELRFWNGRDGRPCGKLEDIQDAFTDAGASDFDSETNEIQDELSAHSDAVTCVVFSPDRKCVATGSDDTTVKVWLTDGSLVAVLQGHKDKINDMAWSPQSRLLASASDDVTVKIWDVYTGRQLHTLYGHSGPARLVRFSPDQCTIASCSDDSTILLWNCETGMSLGRLDAHTAVVKDVSFSAQGKLLASCSEDATAILWDLSSTKRSFLLLKGHSDGIASVTFSQDGERIATCSADKTVKIWSRAGEPLATFIGHDFPVISAAFSPDVDRIVSCSGDMTVRTWSMGTGAVTDIVNVAAVLQSVTFSSDNLRIESERGAFAVGLSETGSSLSSRSASPLFVTQNSIRRNLQSVVRLSTEDPPTSVATWDRRTVLGHASGALSFIEF